MAQTAWKASAIYTFFGFSYFGGPVVRVLDQTWNFAEGVEVNIREIKLSIPKQTLDLGFPIFSVYGSGTF